MSKRRRPSDEFSPHPDAVAINSTDAMKDTLESSAMTPLLTFTTDKEAGKEAEFAVYPRRWWLLWLLSVTSMQQSCVWMTWSPAVGQVQSLYGWSTLNIDLLAAWGPIVYVPLCIFTAKFVDRIGLRASITVAATLTFIGTVIRSLTTRSPWALVLAHTAQILNGAAGPLVCATPSKLSVEWFAPHQRTTATSVSIMANYMGTGTVAEFSLKTVVDLRI